jgi:hypothetical protein
MHSSKQSPAYERRSAQGGAKKCSGHTDRTLPSEEDVLSTFDSRIIEKLCDPSDNLLSTRNTKQHWRLT